MVLWWALVSGALSEIRRGSFKRWIIEFLMERIFDTETGRGILNIGTVEMFILLLLFLRLQEKI